MSDAEINVKEYDAIATVIQHYTEGARTGSGDAMRPAFHADATICGHIGDNLFSGPIEKLFEWNNSNGAAKDIQARLVEVSVAGSVAMARLEVENWTGHRFTDMFTLLKTNGQWQIVNKVFHLHD